MALFHVAGLDPAIQRKCDPLTVAGRCWAYPKKAFIRASASLSSASLAA